MIWFRSFVIIGAILLLCPSSFGAQCKRDLSQPLPSHTNFAVSQSQENWIYSLNVRDDKWQLIPHRHASGIVLCERCLSSGLYNFLASTDQNKALLDKVLPPTARARSATKSETYGYPPKRLGNDELELLETREFISLGTLTGYALRYKVNSTKLIAGTYAQQIRSAKELIVLYASDGCVVFDAKIEARTNARALREKIMDTVISGISITKTRDTAK